MSWLLFSTLAYLLFAVVFLIDRYLLVSRIPDAKTYVFFTGVPSIIVLVIIPFIGFFFPHWTVILLGISAGFVFGLSLYALYRALSICESSRIVPAIGAITPIFSFILIAIFSKGQEALSMAEVPAFLLLILGTFLISREKNSPLRYLKFALPTAFFTAWYFVLTKYVFNSLSFWNGFFWIKIGFFLCAVAFFFLFKSLRGKSFKEGKKMFNNNFLFFGVNKVMGAGAGLLQTYAIFLAPLSGIAIINAMQGVQYVFLLILTIIFAKHIHEQASWKIMFKKGAATIMIVVALAYLVLIHA
jgi:hypothetical protein